MLGIELPRGMLRVADGDPSMPNDITLLAEPFHFAGLEVDWIVGQENQRIGPALEFDGAADVVKSAAAGRHVVVSFVSFEVLVSIVELHVTARDGLVGLVVVFGVI